jgi:hypothetical protein
VLIAATAELSFVFKQFSHPYALTGCLQQGFLLEKAPHAHPAFVASFMEEWRFTAASPFWFAVTAEGK